MTPYYSDAFTTIYHGDCREIMPLLKFDVIVGDPPYGINGNWINATARKKIVGDDSYELAQWLLNYPAPATVVWGAHAFPHLLQPGGRWFVWDKRTNENADRMIGTPYEFAYSNTSGKNVMMRCMHGGVVNANNPGKAREHPTEKPVSMIMQLLAHVPNGIVIDPFMGSGTTLTAARRVGRTSIGIEIDKQYCEIAANRASNEPPTLFE